MKLKKYNIFTGKRSNHREDYIKLLRSGSEEIFKGTSSVRLLPEEDVYPPIELIENMKSLLFRYKKYGFTLFTFDPYIFTFLNICISAHIAAQVAEKEKVANILEKRFWIDPADITAWEIQDNGEYRSMVDESIKIIGASCVDTMSNTLCTIFDNLLRLELEAKENK